MGQTLTLNSLSSLIRVFGLHDIDGKTHRGFWGKLSFELREVALNYLNSKLLFVLLFPMLKLFGYLDSLTNSSEGNGILVLAQKSVH